MLVVASSQEKKNKTKVDFYMNAFTQLEDNSIWIDR